MKRELPQDDSKMLMPSWQACASMERAMDIWKELTDIKTQTTEITSKSGELDSDEIFNQIFLEPTLSSEIVTPEAAIQEMGEIPVGLDPEQEVSHLIEKLIKIIVAYVVKSFKEEIAENMGAAWHNAMASAYWAGILVGHWAHVSCKNNPAAALAHLRHAETRQLKEFAIQFWRDNVDPNLSAQKAATALLQANAVNLSHKKLAEVISAEKKKIQK